MDKQFYGQACLIEKPTKNIVAAWVYTYSCMLDSNLHRVLTDHLRDNLHWGRWSYHILFHQPANEEDQQIVEKQLFNSVYESQIIIHIHSWSWFRLANLALVKQGGGVFTYEDIWGCATLQGVPFSTKLFLNMGSFFQKFWVFAKKGLYFEKNP